MNLFGVSHPYARVFQVCSSLGQSKNKIISWNKRITDYLNSYHKVKHIEKLVYNIHANYK